MESGREDARAAPRRAGRAAGRGDAAFWPFGARSALVAVPLIALALFAAFALARAIADWPEPRSDNLILAGVLLLSLLPLVLLLLDALATRGGAIEIRGVKIDFAVQLGRRSELTVATNVGVPGVPIPDTSSAQILDTLRAAVANEIAVVDLEDGAAWWETRLLVLCAGAARVGRPAVIVFVATEHAERRCFQGWAPPHPLLQALLRSDRRYRESFYAARAAVSQWSVVPPPGPGQPLPPNPPGATGLAAQHPWIAFTDTNEPNEHAQEQFLAADLGAKAEPPATGLSVVRLRELFAAALYTNAIDRRWSDDRRVEAVLGSDASYTAITDGGRYIGLLSRAAAHNSILEALVARARHSATPDLCLAAEAGGRRLDSRAQHSRGQRSASLLRARDLGM